MAIDCRGWVVRSVLVAACGVAGVWSTASAAASVFAAQPAADEKLPSGKDVLEKYIEKTGGKAAYEKINTKTATIKMEMPSMGMNVSMQLWASKPNKLAVEMSIPGFGKVRQGTDGNTAWRVSDMEGAKILDGEEKAQVMQQAVFNSELRYNEMYEKIDCVGVETINGKAAYRLELTPKPGMGQKTTQFYEKDSGLLVKQTMATKGAAGDVVTETVLSDYKKVANSDVLFPHKTVQKVMGMEQILTFEKLDLNTDIPAEKFAVPDGAKKADKPAVPTPEGKTPDVKPPAPDVKPPAPDTKPAPPEVKKPG